MDAQNRSASKPGDNNSTAPGGGTGRHQTRSSTKKREDPQPHTGLDSALDNGGRNKDEHEADKDIPSSPRGQLQVVMRRLQETERSTGFLKAFAAVIIALVISHWILNKFPQYLPDALHAPGISDFSVISEGGDLRAQVTQLQNRLKALPADLPEKYQDVLPQGLRKWIAETTEQRKTNRPTAWTDLPETYLSNLPQELEDIARDYEILLPQVAQSHPHLGPLSKGISRLILSALVTAGTAGGLLLIINAARAAYRYVEGHGYFKSRDNPGRVNRAKEKVSIESSKLSKSLHESIIDPLQESVNDSRTSQPTDGDEDHSRGEVQEGNRAGHI